MRKKWFGRLLSIIVAGAMVFNIASVRAYADESAPGKYVKDVFIAYGKTEKQATEWLTKNGWEPLAGDLNAGKASFFDDNKIQDQNVAAVLGIKRTNKEKDAVTDMAVMNMSGGYSIPDYSSLLKTKKSEIDEFVNSFMPVIEEFRANRSGKGSSYGQKRADLAYDILNTFYDGDPKGDDAVHDTGMKLGDLFMQQTMQEGNEKGGDLQQIMLESSGGAMIAVEALLVMGADPGEETWLKRASGLTGDELAENLVKYVPEAEGQDIAPSAVSQYLSQKYGETAKVIAGQWSDVNEQMLWYENYNKENDLWQKENESDEDYAARTDKFFKDLKAADEDRYDAECTTYHKYAILYNGLYEMPYEGDWGETLGDFFNPVDDKEYVFNSDSFLPLAAGLSNGQRAGMDYLSLETLLLIGLGSEESFDYIAPDLKDLFGDETTFDIYTGVKRDAFRNGVAITSRALMEQNAGKGEAFDQIWDNVGIVAISTYAAAVVGAVALGAGWYMTANGYINPNTQSTIDGLTAVRDRAWKAYDINLNDATFNDGLLNPKLLKEYETAQKNLDKAQNARKITTGGYTGRVLMGVGGALLIAAVPLGEADAGGHGEKARAAALVDPARLQGRADHPVQPGGRGVLRIGENHLLHGAGDQQLALQGFLVRAGELGDGDEQGPCPVGPGETLQSGLHHGPGAGGVEVHQIHVQAGEHPHGLFHGIGDVVQLQIQKDPVAPGLEAPHDLRSLGIEELHADLHKGLFSRKAVQKSQGLVSACEVAGDDDVLSHGRLL